MGFRRILVPVNGTQTDEEVLRLACSLARGYKAKIFVVHVVEVQRTLPLDVHLETELLRGEDTLTRAELLGEDEECEVEASLLQAREVGPALVEEAVVKEADLIFLGMSYKRRFGEFSMGDVLPYVLRHATCPVLLLRLPPAHS